MGRNELQRELNRAIVFSNNCETWIYGIGDSAELYQQGLERVWGERDNWLLRG